MLVIVANRQDEVATWLAHRWQSCSAVLFTSADLSTSGWRHYLPPSSRSRAMLAGQSVVPGEITGVLTRIPCVYEQELGHIVPDDRPYVASEMTAFLLSWLSSLTCPVLNAPTPGCLAGPNLKDEQWVRLAASLGIPVSPVRRSTSRNSQETAQQSVCEMIVVGDQCFGTAAPELSAQARSLAAAAGADLLAVEFAGAEPGSPLVSANVWPNLASPEIADAVLNRLLRRSVC
jgi:hypothetical protein